MTPLQVIRVGCSWKISCHGLRNICMSYFPVLQPRLHVLLGMVAGRRCARTVVNCYHY